MSVSPEVVAAALQRLEGLSMSASDMRRLAHSPPTWALGSPRPGDMVLCAKDPLRLGVVTDVRGGFRQVALAGTNGESRAARQAALRALPAAALAGRPSTAPRSVDEMVRGAVVVALGDLVDEVVEVARRALPEDAVAPRELLARRGSAGGGVGLGAADASGDMRGVFYSRCSPPVNGGAVEVFVSGNAGAAAQRDAAATEASAALEPLHFKTTTNKSSDEYLKIARALGEAIAESGCGEEGISPAAALLLFAKRESRKLNIDGAEVRQLNFWKYSDFWSCVNRDVSSVKDLRLIPKRAEVTVPEPLSLAVSGRDYARKGSEEHLAFSRVIAKAVDAAYAAAEQKPISIAAVLKKAKELEGRDVRLLGSGEDALRFWKNSEFWDVVSRKVKLGSIRLLPKSAAPAVGKRAASGADKPAKKRARK